MSSTIRVCKYQSVDRTNTEGTYTNSYTANLPKEADEELVHSLFLSFGNIVNLKKNNNYIDIQFQDIEDATASVENMKGFSLYDRYLQVTKIGEFNPMDNLQEKTAIWEQNNE